jgi:Family of unknown function (DUF6152)
MPVKLMATVAAALVLAMPAFGHHSDAALDMKTVTTFAGTVTEFSWRNPHAYFTVDARDERGRTVEWTVQMPSTITMARRGWTRDSLAVGDQVTVGVYPARDGRPYGLLQSIEKPGGIVSSFDRTSGELRFASTAATATTSTIEGRWMADTAKLAGYPGGLDNITRTLLKLTPKGQAALEAYDDNSTENPLVDCTVRPTPAMILYTNLYPIEIEFNEAEQTISIRGQFFDEERTVYMDGRGHPDASVRFTEGHSIGRWEGDVLVVDTANFADHRSPYQNGIPSGGRKHVVERYRLLEGGTRMAVEFMLEDPEYIAEPMTHSRELIYSPQVEMTPFNCDLESTRRFLPQ